MFSVNTFSQDTNFWVFLCFGQSNMEGIPGIQPRDKVNVDDRFQVMAAVDFPELGRKRGHWYPGVPPLCRPSTGLCPADYFGRTMVANLPKNIRVGVVVVAVAGCKIELFQQTQRDWPHEKSVSLGMYDTRNLTLRSEKCLTCHLGTAEKFVDHEMIAAGHPDLTFELDLFSTVMPRHWKMPESYETGAWRQVQAWGVGEAVQLRESLNRVSRRAKDTKGAWPEYAELDCFACHHSLTMPLDSWRQERGYPGRRPGNPPWNQSREVMFRALVEEISPGAAKQFNDESTRLAGLMNQLNGNREEVGASADRAAALADQMAKQVEGQNYDSALTLRLLRRVAGDGAAIANEGERPAEQAAMTLDSLFTAYNQNAKPANGADVRAAIDALFQQLQNPSAYSAPRFAAQMQRVSELLGR